MSLLVSFVLFVFSCVWEGGEEGGGGFSFFLSLLFAFMSWGVRYRITSLYNPFSVEIKSFQFNSIQNGM